MSKKETREITRLILKAAEQARKETSGEPEAALTQPVHWPVRCEVGPGLEGAIACESEIGYVNGTKGRLIYCGYDIFDLAAHSTFEEVSFLLLKGHLPTRRELEAFNAKLVACRHIPQTIRQMQGFPVERMNTMAALRLGTNMMRRESTYLDEEIARPSPEAAPVTSAIFPARARAPPESSADAATRWRERSASQLAM